MNATKILTSQSGGTTYHQWTLPFVQKVQTFWVEVGEGYNDDDEECILSEKYAVILLKKSVLSHIKKGKAPYNFESGCYPVVQLWRMDEKLEWHLEDHNHYDWLPHGASQVKTLLSDNDYIFEMEPDHKMNPNR
jgi:hypothetical protein